MTTTTTKAENVYKFFQFTMFVQGSFVGLAIHSKKRHRYTHVVFLIRDNPDACVCVCVSVCIIYNRSSFVFAQVLLNNSARYIRCIKILLHLLAGRCCISHSVIITAPTNTTTTTPTQLWIKCEGRKIKRPKKSYNRLSILSWYAFRLAYLLLSPGTSVLYRKSTGAL